MTPTASTQIHFPDLAPPLTFRVRSAVIVARRRFGVALLAGGGVLALSSMRPDPASSTAVVMVATWVVAALVAVFTAARAGSWRSHVGPSARLSWALFFAGLALVAPLSLHALLQPWEWAPGFYDYLSERSLWGWVRASVYLTGPSHIVFALLCFLRGFRGDRKPHLALIGVVTTLVALVDVVWWGGYALLPTAYVAATVIPLLYGLRRIERMHE